ncbi:MULTISPECIES: hypothetical protein [Pectobacterium]|uniref:hypothetical protein n=1 Tax=Pectobacterium TaxID=122277 RepID=UPI001968E7B9|nr:MULTISPECIES: hypothetical protein [Pectobacterium]MBN3132398.1 hypothetical protein [Pectobacterium brasiliense]
MNTVYASKRKNKYNIACVFFALFLVFGGVYKTPIGDVSTVHIILLFSISKFFLFFYQRNKSSVMGFLTEIREYIYYIIILLFLFLFSLVNYYFFYIGDEFFVALQLKRITITIVSLVAFGFLINDTVKRSSPKEIFFATFYFLLFVLLLSIIQLSNESFRVWYVNQTAVDGYWLEWAQTSTRAIGLKGISIWDTSIAYTILCFVSIYTLNSPSFNDKLYFVLFMFVIAILTIVSGRTGLIFFLFFSIISGVMLGKARYILFFYFSIILILFSITINSTNELINKIAGFSFELFINLINGDFSTNSTNDLLNNHLFIPEVKHYLFGDNFYIGDGDVINSKLGRSSDSAFVINYVSYGFFGFLLTLILVYINIKIFMSYFIIKRKNFFYYISFIACTALTIGLYIKVPVYVSATLLKSMLFVTLCMNSIKEINIKNSEINEKREKA